MTLEQVVDLVRRMRAKQREYFRSRNTTVLAECRDLERHVDEALKELTDQPSLFDER